MNIRRGWEVEYSNGTIINENQMEWKKISNSCQLQLNFLLVIYF